MRRERGNLGARGRSTSFVGREQELARLLDLLGENRLVTLTGPGGVGKTRLSVEAARRFGVERTDTVWLVELAGLSEGSLAALAVLDTLGLSERPRLDADGPVLGRSAAGASRAGVMSGTTRERSRRRPSASIAPGFSAPDLP